MVSPTTIGAASWPRSTPSDMVNSTFSRPTLAALIWFSSENRVEA